MPAPIPCAERLLAALAARLTGLAIDGVPVAVERDRVAPVTERDAPRLVVYEDSSTCDQTLLGGTDAHTLTVAVVGYVRGPVDPAGDDRRAARDGAEAAARRQAAILKALVHQRLCGGGPFAGAAADLALAQDIRPAGSPPPDRLGMFGGDPAASFTALYDVAWDSPTGDPFAFL